VLPRSAAAAINRKTGDLLMQDDPFPTRTGSSTIGLASAAVAVTRAGAQRVEAVILGGSTARVAGVSRIRLIGQEQAHVA